MQRAGRSGRAALGRTFCLPIGAPRHHHTARGTMFIQRHSQCSSTNRCGPTTRLGSVAMQPVGASFSSLALRPLTALSEDGKDLRDTVRKFAEEEIRPLVTKMDEESKMSLDVISALFQQGFMGMEVDVNEGGRGLSFSDSLIVVEELSRVDPSVGFIVGIHNTLVLRAVAMHGTEDQKKHYLSKLCSDTVGSFCLSESPSNSDPCSVKCLATRDESRKGWVLSGSKQGISNSEEAGLFLVFATTDPEKQHEGISCFLVDAGMEGVSVGRKGDTLGMRASSTCEVILENVFVPDDQVLGSVGEGYKLATSLLDEGRIGIAAQMLGLAQGAFDIAVPYISEQCQQNPADFQGVRFQAAELAIEIEAARLLVYNAAALKSAALPFAKEAAMAKYKASRVAEKVSSQCIEFFGGHGYTKEFPLEKYYRDAKLGVIYEGMGSTQLETIFKLVAQEYV